MQEEKSMKVFTYGLLKPGSDFFNKELKEKVTKIEHAYVQGILSGVKGKDYSGILEGQGKVDGKLLTFEDDTLLESIDDYEDEGKIYKRVEYDVYTWDPAFPVNRLTPEKAWVYFLIPEFANELVRPATGCEGCSDCG